MSTKQLQFGKLFLSSQVLLDVQILLRLLQRNYFFICMSMSSFSDLQKSIYDNKVAKGFNVTDIPLEFAYLYGELGEAFEAWRKKKDDL
jgi:hypothetical protein